MILTDNGEIESVDESKEESTPPLEDVSKVEYPIEGEVFVTKLSLSAQAKEEEQQRENIFHT